MYWDVYAYIYEDLIKDIAVFDPNGSYTLANQIAKHLYGSKAYALNVTNYPVAIGDTCKDGAFYHNGVIVEKVDKVGDDITDIQLALTELASMITEN